MELKPLQEMSVSELTTLIEKGFYKDVEIDDVTMVHLMAELLQRVLYTGV